MLRSLLLALVLAPSAEEATCNIPVFRYALERWPAESYEVVAFHRGSLTGEQEAALNVLRQSGANLEVDRINVAEPAPSRRMRLLERFHLEPPVLLALYPGTETAAWHGPWDAEAARRLVESPARREISRRLLDGQSGVWILLESGDAAKDESAAAFLGTELQGLERTLKLPLHAADDPPLLLDLPVQVSFSICRVSRSDPAEQAFATILSNSDVGLRGPVVFPVFGRGRALWAMAGEGLKTPYIGDAGAFLTGACSCEAKEFNPGFDLLFAADWEAGLSAAPERERIPVPMLKARPPGTAPASAPPRGSETTLWIALLVAGLLVAFTGRRLLAVSKGAR